MEDTSNRGLAAIEEEEEVRNSSRTERHKVGGKDNIELVNSI